MNKAKDPQVSRRGSRTRMLQRDFYKKEGISKWNKDRTQLMVLPTKGIHIYRARIVITYLRIQNFKREEEMKRPK